VIETIGFPPDSLQRRVNVRTGSHQLHGEFEPRQRGPELVGHVLQQPALGREQCRNLIGHSIEGPGQIADLVAPSHMQANPEVAPSESFQNAAQAA
jgi:hypothetical protein